MIEPPLELHATLREVLAGLIPELADFGFIHMLEEEGGTVREVAVRHRDAARETRLRRALRRFRPGVAGPGSLVDRVLESGEPERIEGPAARRAFEEVADDDPDDLRRIREFLPRAHLVLPLAHGGRVFGTVSLARAETNLRFTDREIVLLSGAAAQAALAIRNAFLLEGSVGAEARRDLVPTAPDRSGLRAREAGPSLHPDLSSAVAAAVADLVADRLRDLKEDLVVEMVDRSAAGSTGSAYHQMVRGIDRARGALSALVTFGRRERPGDDGTRLNAVVRGVADRLEQRARDADVELALDLDPNAGDVRADPPALGRALLALLDGVIAGAPGGTRLRIRTARERVPGQRETDAASPAGAPSRRGAPSPPRARDYGSVEVDGGALDVEVPSPERLLELFDPVDPAADRPHALGLLAAYGTARRAGGRLRLERRAGGGARVRILLPVAGAGADATGKPDAAGSTSAERAGAGGSAADPERRTAGEDRAATGSATASAGPATVLLLEGQEGEREAAARLLREAGLRVLAAADESEARRRWETSEGEVDAVIVDADGGRRGPDEGEPSLVDHLRMVRPDLPVLYSSRTPGMERALVRMSDRHTHFIGKPFARERLLDTLRKVLPEPPGV